MIGCYLVELPVDINLRLIHAFNAGAMIEETEKFYCKRQHGKLQHLETTQCHEWMFRMQKLAKWKILELQSDSY